MKYSFNDLINFNAFYNSIGDFKLSLKTSYKLMKINQLSSNEIQFYQSKLKDIINEYAQKNDDGEIQYNDDKTQILINPDRIEMCNERIQELLNLETNLDISDYILDISEFEEMSVSPRQLESIIKFIK